MVWPSSDLAGYRVLIAPHLKIVTPELVAKFEQFVVDGGTLVLGAQSGLKDINCHMVEMTAARSPAEAGRRGGGRLDNGAARRELCSAPAPRATVQLNTFGPKRLSPTGAEVIGKWETQDPLLCGAPAIARNRLGKGSVYYIGGYCHDSAAPRCCNTSRTS